jgi:hypothetical protein
MIGDLASNLPKLWSAKRRDHQIENRSCSCRRNPVGNPRRNPGWGSPRARGAGSVGRAAAGGAGAARPSRSRAPACCRRDGPARYPCAARRCTCVV